MSEPASPEAPIWLVPFLLVTIPLFWVGISCFVLKLLAMASGWSRIARRFPRLQAPRGRKYGMCSALFGLVGYNNCLTIWASEEGLDIAMWRLFSFGHRPIFIPWTEVRKARLHELLFYKGIWFEAGSPSAGKIKLPEKVFAEMPVSLPPSP